jgi:hypothetical protein
MAVDFERSGKSAPADEDRLLVERLYAAWQRAEKRAREAAPGSLEAAERAVGVDQLWEAYEEALAKAVGRGSLRRTN